MVYFRHFDHKRIFASLTAHILMQYVAPPDWRKVHIILGFLIVSCVKQFVWHDKKNKNVTARKWLLFNNKRGVINIGGKSRTFTILSSNIFYSYLFCYNANSCAHNLRLDDFQNMCVVTYSLHRNVIEPNKLIRIQFLTV